MGLSKYRVFASMCPQAREPSDDVPADEGFLRDEAAALGGHDKGNTLFLISYGVSDVSSVKTRP